jgi:hypothetical protein
MNHLSVTLGSGLVLGSDDIFIRFLLLVSIIFRLSKPYTYDLDGNDYIHSRYIFYQGPSELGGWHYTNHCACSDPLMN